MACLLLANVSNADSRFRVWLIFIVAVFSLPMIIKIVLMWIVLPLKLWRKPLLMVDPKWEATEGDKVSPEMADFLGPLIPLFRAEGFEVVANVSKDGAVANAKGTNLLLVNRQSQEFAQIILAQARLHRNYVFSFTSRFPDGSEIRTGINREIGCFPKDPNVDSVAVAWTVDVRQIVEFHRRRVRHLGRERNRRIVPAAGQEIEFLTQRWHEEASVLVASGYCYLDSAAGAYRRTLQGSCLTIWKLIPSVKKLRIRLRNRRSRQMWRMLSMDSYVAPRTQITGSAAPVPDVQETSTAHGNLSDALQ